MCNCVRAHWSKYGSFRARRAEMRCDGSYSSSFAMQSMPVGPKISGTSRSAVRTELHAGLQWSSRFLVTRLLSPNSLAADQK